MPLPPIAAKLMIDRDTGRPFVVEGPLDTTPQVVHTAQDATRAKFRALIAATTAAKASLSQPLAKAPSWQPANSYFVGTVVRGVGAGNTDNLFLCVQSGVSAGAGGPSGRGAAGIFDNEARWLHIGVGTAESTFPLWASAAPAAATDVMDGYLAFVNDGDLATLGLTRRLRMTYPAGWVGNLTGGIGYQTYVANSVEIIGPNVGTVAAPQRASSAARWTLHVQTDCRKWFGFQPASPIYARRLYIEVNGRPLCEGQIGHNVTLGGGVYLLNLSRFEGVKDIKIFGTDAVHQVVESWLVGADEHVWTPNYEANLTMAFEGDSITQGAGTGEKLLPNFVEHLICRELGIPNRYNNAIGGTGAIANANGNATTYLQRLPDLAAVNPDIVLVGGFHNDVNFGAAGVLAYLKALRAACPNAIVFVVGTQMLGNENTAAGQLFHSLERGVKAAFDEWGDPDSHFIPLLTDANPFPPTTADGWYYQDALAAPFNDSHPTPRYYPAYAAIVVNAIKRYFSS